MINCILVYISVNIRRRLLLGGPFWRLVLACIFELVALFFGLVDGGLGVLGRCVDREEAEGGGTGIDDYASARVRSPQDAGRRLSRVFQYPSPQGTGGGKRVVQLTIMFRPLGNDDHIPRLDVPLFARHDRLARPARKDQMLVYMMHLLPDIAADRDGHHYHLGRLARPYDRAEVWVLGREGVDG